MDVRHLLRIVCGISKFILAITTFDQEEEQEEPVPRARFRRRRDRTSLAPAPSWWKTPHSDPQPAGVKLLLSGEFGRVRVKQMMYQREGWRMDEQERMVRDDKENAEPGIGRERPNLHPRYKLDYRLRSIHEKTRYMPREDLVEELVPNTNGTVVASYPKNVYCGQFSTGMLFALFVCVMKD
jgi:WD repeat-containing protein 23